MRPRAPRTLQAVKETASTGCGGPMAVMGGGSSCGPGEHVDGGSLPSGERLFQVGLGIVFKWPGEGLRNVQRTLLC
jgi:hypothetical protein